jgi:hypothetical protein
MNASALTFEELENVLAKECEAHEQMLQAAQAVNAAIRQSDLETLQKNTAYLDGRICLVEQLEERRKDCCGALARSLGIGRASLKLSALIEKAPAAAAGKLAGLHTSLRGLLEKIAKVTVSNRILINEGLELVRGRLNLAAQSAGRFDHYGQRGSRATARAPLHPFINRTV